MKKTSIIILKIITIITVSILLIKLYNSYFLNEIDDLFDINTKRKIVSNGFNGSVVHKVILVTIVPFFEELLYRLGLKYSIRNATFFAIGIIFTFFIFVFPNIDLQNPLIAPAIVLFFLVLFLVIHRLIKKNSIVIEKFYSKKLNVIFYVSILLFGYSHFVFHANYNNFFNILLSPIILMPYFLAGYIYGKLRINYGFFGLFAHVFWNFLVIILYDKL